jgi:hypothetical protein
MNLLDFLRTLKPKTKTEIVFRGESGDVKVKDTIKYHLFDVVEWSVVMNNYEPLVVVKVK